MKIEINAADFNTIFEAELFLAQEIEKKLPTNTTSIVSNCKIMSVLQDIANFEWEPQKQAISAPCLTYEIGWFNFTTGKVKMLVDPCMLWTDTRVIFKKDEEIIKEIEVVDYNEILI